MALSLTSSAARTPAAANARPQARAVAVSLFMMVSLSSSITARDIQEAGNASPEALPPCSSRQAVREVVIHTKRHGQHPPLQGGARHGAAHRGGQPYRICRELTHGKREGPPTKCRDQEESSAAACPTATC